ncbi:MAG: cation transporter [Aquabacterium sp.]|nr:MAG: cation transporter [Aquabacterium sp.]
MSVQRWLHLSIAAAVATIGLKTLAWWLTGSVGLLSDAMESFVNLAAAVFALWMVTVAHAPPDDEHPYGHGKAQYFSSGFEALLILGASGGIAWAAVQRFAQPQPIDQPVLGVVLSMVSSVINGGVAWMLMRASRQHHSIALEADARHLYTDVWTSIGVAVGVFLVQATGWLWLDPLLALGVAANITREAWSLLRRSVDGLMDHGLEPAELAAIDTTLQRLAAEARGAVRFDHVRSRRAAQDKFCQMHMHVPGDWSLARAAAQREGVERALMEAVRGLRVTIELLPADVEALNAATPSQEA